MTQQKQSFFEKLTGIKRINESDEDEFIINTEESSISQDDKTDGFAPASFEIDDETYKVPNKSLEQTKPMEELSKEQIDEPAEESIIQTPVSDKPATNVATDTGTEIDDSEGQLTIDVYQTDDDVIIKSTIAGVKPEDLDVSINNDMITIKGERKQEDEISLDNYYYQECYWGLFSRSVILPVEIISDKAEAIMKNGILTLKLPKADITKTRKIQVRGF